MSFFGAMLEGGMGSGWIGGYGGMAAAVLLIVVVIGFVIWVTRRKGE
jgi:hypothetical protein